MKALAFVVQHVSSKPASMDLRALLEAMVGTEADILLKSKEGHLYFERLADSPAVSAELLPSPRSLTRLADARFQAALCKYDVIMGVSETPDKLKAHLAKLALPGLVLIADLGNVGDKCRTLFSSFGLRTVNAVSVAGTTILGRALLPTEWVVDLTVPELYSRSSPCCSLLLRWLVEGLCRVEATDLVLEGCMPTCLYSPVTLRASGLVTTQERPSVVRLCSDKAAPSEIYAIGRNGEDDSTTELRLIEPAFGDLFRSLFVKRDAPQTVSGASQPQTSTWGREHPESHPSLQDASISLRNWMPSQEILSQPTTSHDAIKAENKNMLKKMMLLSLRHVGMDKHHREFPSVWKHLYCGCLFALRKELGSHRVSQADMLATIRSNMNFLNIK